MATWRWATLGAATTVVVGMSFAQVPGIDACGAAGSAGQWLTFQTITSVADVRAMIRPDCAAAFVPALRQSMWLDALAFIPAFSLLLMAAMIALKPKRWLLLAGLLALAGGAAADQLEGWNLLRILEDLPGTADGVHQVVIAHVAKKFLLALGTGAIGIALLQIAGWRRAAGFVVLLGALAALANTIASFDGGEAGLLVSWLAVAVVAVAGAVAQWRQARPAAPTPH